MKNRMMLDVFFYIAIPLIAWNFFREHWGDYYTILFGMVPGVIYTVATFLINKESNITGIFFLSIITLNFVMNLFSSTAEEELWNAVWLGYASIVFYSITILIRKPLGIFFFIDYAFAKGIPRDKSRAVYRAPENFHHFIKFTLFLILREIIVIVVKTTMINEMGVEGFNAIQITTSVINYAFTGLTIFYVIYILKHIKKAEPEQDLQASPGET